MHWVGARCGLRPGLHHRRARRHFVFVVPAGRGVREAGLVGFGYLLGPGNDAGIALSPAKRMREVLLGVPALVSWHLT